MQVIRVDDLAIRIPNVPSRYRANCAKEYGQFVHGETAKMTALQVKEAGLMKGQFVEMALCWTDSRILTFKPNYINEPFQEIWGIPTAGEMKEQFGDKCSELSTFLLHRQSKDKLQHLVESFSRDAFIQWVNEGMPGDPEDYALSKMKDLYLGSIFRFEFVQMESDYGPYFYVQVSKKVATTPFELAALNAARQIYQMQLNGEGVCTDLRLLDNEAQCLSQTVNTETVDTDLKLVNPAKNGKRKSLAPSK